MQAASRAFQATSSLPLGDISPTDPENEGKQRLKGAFLIELHRIIRDDAQPRRAFDVEQMQHLIDSVRERGIRQPIRVWWNAARDRYQIVSGERRFRAAEAAGLPAIPCIIDDLPTQTKALDRKHILVDQIVENWQRADLNPYELSDALAQLRDEQGMSQDEIARLIGKPKSEVSRFLAMQKVEPGVQQQIRSGDSGTFSRRHVVAISQLSEENQANLADKVRMEKLTAAETEREAARLRRRRDGKTPTAGNGTIRRFAVGSARVQITFRKAQVTDQEVLEVLTRVRSMIEAAHDQAA